jgi:hypothetical protein
MFEHPRRNAMADTSRQPTAPETERVIAGIWCDVLDLPEVGMTWTAC